MNLFHFYRYSTLHFKDYISGAKSCIELVAVHSANQEEMLKEKSYLRCFKRFIKYLRNFDQLNVQIVGFGKKGRKVVDKSLPRVIDPVNPYNNLASNWNLKSIELVKDYANETKRRLDSLGSRRSIDLHLLFKPQSVYCNEVEESDSSQWLVGSILMDPDSFLADVEIRKNAKTARITHCGWVWKF